MAAVLSSVSEIRSAGLAILASDERIVAAYLDSFVGEVVVLRSGDVFLAADYDLERHREEVRRTAQLLAS